MDLKGKLIETSSKIEELEEQVRRLEAELILGYS